MTNLAGATVVNASITPDLTTLNSVNGLVGISAINVATTVKTLGLSGTASDDNDLTVTYKTGLAGTTDALTLNVNGNSAATVADATKYAVVTANGAGAGEGFDLVTVNSNGTATRLDALVVGDGTNSTMKTLTITGGANFRVNTALDFLGTTGTLDASAATGAVNVAFGAEDITVTGGAGNDRFNFGATLDAADKVNGGAGTDTLAISSTIDSTTTALNKVINAVTGMDVLEVTQANAAVDASQITFTKAFAATGGGTTAFTNTVNDNTFAFSANAGATTFAPTIDGGNDVLNLTVGGASAVTLTSVAASAGGFETINVASTSSTGAANEITTTNVSANGKIVVTGAANFTTTAAGTNATIDGSAATGKLTLTGEAGNNTIIGGSADDVLTGGDGIDTIDLSKGGQDRVVIAATAAANRDVVKGFTAGTGGDILDINMTLGTAALASVTGTGTAFTITATNAITAFNFAATNNSADLGKVGVVDGTELLKGIANAGSTITSLTVTAADTGYLLAYSGTNAYLYYYSSADASLVASEIALVGVVEGVATGSLVAGNFV
ncbi:hypothetical protein RY831_31025 [Noviherbaspirillum sp. CPCC 100848]|uniref:Uncharacterized protein n=1 Tax=Noviherbaspirillum album TaxID=3080276 RepID=A0ABU6JIQ1_9BURK|nr:hypothetical protein [Noviherbaspirillum sp. CPCC 100848]MEC4723575.1 hypothetical protein [Noviherbaspirillum sp. CPCC 100848]